jgi:hypothetical protein
MLTIYGHHTGCAPAAQQHQKQSLTGSRGQEAASTLFLASSLQARMRRHICCQGRRKRSVACNSTQADEGKDPVVGSSSSRPGERCAQGKFHVPTQDIALLVLLTTYARHSFYTSLHRAGRTRNSWPLSLFVPYKNLPSDGQVRSSSSGGA